MEIEASGSTVSSGIIREVERRQLTHIHPVTWWRWERAGTAPKRVKLGPNSVGWLRSEILAWLEACASARSPSPLPRAAARR